MKPVQLTEQELKKIFRADTAWRRGLRLVWRTIKQLLGLVAIFFVFFFAINYPAYASRWRFEVQQANSVTPPTPTPTPAPEIIRPSTLSLPKLGLNPPIIYGVPAADITAGLKQGVVHYEGTARPGERGNSVLVGHSSDFPWSDGGYKTIFALLDKLTIGDKIVVDYQNRLFEYTVTVKKVVSPNDLTILKRSPDPILTLLTCYPVGTTRSRLIIQATLTSGNVTGDQQGSPPIEESLPRPR